MDFDLGIFALCASAGVAGGILLAWIKVFERHQTLVIMVTLAAFVAICLLGDDLSILPNPTMKALSSLSVHFTPLIVFPFIGAWLLTFLGRRFWADLMAYRDEQFGPARNENVRHDRN